jgi:hypothetical protein
MDSRGELEFTVQVLARCLGSALALGRPTRVQIHYCNSQAFNAGQSGAAPLNSEEVERSRPSTRS